MEDIPLHGKDNTKKLIKDKNDGSAVGSRSTALIKGGIDKFPTLSKRTFSKRGQVYILVKIVIILLENFYNLQHIFSIIYKHTIFYYLRHF